ncbi:unnamed protein product [Ectocarpus sp. CCAP 1310/34]|nr:unnamed protein product [Ectocarpus sp. CCAP 1310/34]
MLFSFVRKIVDDQQVSHVDPNIIQQPNISAEKLSRMWATAKAKWNQPYANWKSESGNNQPWLSFCQGKGWVEWGWVQNSVCLLEEPWAILWSWHKFRPSSFTACKCCYGRSFDVILGVLDSVVNRAPGMTLALRPDGVF